MRGFSECLAVSQRIRWPLSLISSFAEKQTESIFRQKNEFAQQETPYETKLYWKKSSLALEETFRGQSSMKTIYYTNEIRILEPRINSNCDASTSLPTNSGTVNAFMEWIRKFIRLSSETRVFEIFDKMMHLHIQLMMLSLNWRIRFITETFSAGFVAECSFFSFLEFSITFFKFISTYIHATTILDVDFFAFLLRPFVQTRRDVYLNAFTFSPLNTSSLSRQIFEYQESRYWSNILFSLSHH